MDVVIMQAGQQQTAIGIQHALARQNRQVTDFRDQTLTQPHINALATSQFRPAYQHSCIGMVTATGHATRPKRVSTRCQAASASSRRTSRRSSLPISL